VPRFLWIVWQVWGRAWQGFHIPGKALYRVLTRLRIKVLALESQMLFDLWW
jgi:hypothetical protein